MVWVDHVTATQAKWVIRYNDPTEASWKKLWDYMILEDNRYKHMTTHRLPEGRAALLLPLQPEERLSIVSPRINKHLPKKAKYLCEQRSPLALLCGFLATPPPAHALCTAALCCCTRPRTC